MSLPQVTNAGRLGLAIGALLLAGLFSVIFGWICDLTFGHDRWTGFVLAHFALVLGLPMAAALAFGIVISFYLTAEQPMAIRLGPLEITGPATPILLWAACFLAIVLAIRLLAVVETPAA
jgi:hypothetical protein